MGFLLAITRRPERLAGEGGLTATIPGAAQPGLQLGGALVQVAQCRAQAVQIALGARRAGQHQVPPCLGQHGVDALGHLWGKSAGEAGAGVVVALAGVDRQLGRTGLLARQRLLAEICRHFEHEGELTAPHVLARLPGVGVAAVGELALLFDRRQHLAAEVQGPAAVLGARVQIHQPCGQIPGVRGRIPHRKQVDPGINRRDEQHTRHREGEFAVCAQQLPFAPQHLARRAEPFHPHGLGHVALPKPLCAARAAPQPSAAHLLRPHSAPMAHRAHS